MTPILDPRLGDIEDDSSSTKKHSLLSLAGALLAEISLPKLFAVWLMLIALPSFLLGMAPIVASIWFDEIFGRVTSFQAEIWSTILLAALVAVALFSSKRLFRLAESSFWALNALAVQPVYATCREALRHLVEQPKAKRGGDISSLRAASALAAGLLIGGLALLALFAAWPHTLFVSDFAIFQTPRRLAFASLANSVVLVSAYVAVASLAWAIADAAMEQPRDLERFDPQPPDGRVWRVAHLSDIHIVGENYGFRIESGRAGPQGNVRLKQALDRLEEIHADDPLHAIIVTGDVTDAGLSSEWAAFFDMLARHKCLAEVMVVAPGNHDLNIVDRANPARLDLPTSPNKRLRKLRVLSALAAVQGDRVHVVDGAARRLGASLSEAIEPLREAVADFADTGRPVFSRALSDLWARAFPQVLPPQREDGLGVILLNSNADTHFSFTNALGMVPAEQAEALAIAHRLYPKAFWIVALHHHVVEYPRPAKALSERIGTALINGNWFVRFLRRRAGRIVVMHGHRHIDWIGRCGPLRLISAPSPVMEAGGGRPSAFYIHRLAPGADGRLKLLQPEKIALADPPGAA